MGERAKKKECRCVNVKWSLKALLRSGSKRARTEHSQRTPGVMVSPGLCAVLYRRLVQDRKRRLLLHFGGQLRASDAKRTTRQATTVRPRGTGRRRTFITPSLVGLHSLQARLRWTTASGRPWSPRFQWSVFIEGCSQSTHCPCICCGRGVRCS